MTGMLQRWPAHPIGQKLPAVNEARYTNPPSSLQFAEAPVQSRHDTIATFTYDKCMQ
jgi:hypothetical protein